MDMVILVMLVMLVMLNLMVSGSRPVLPSLRKKFIN